MYSGLIVRRLLNRTDPKGKNMSLNQTNKAAFLALARAATDEFSGNDDFTALPEEIKAALQEQIADAKKDAAKVAAREIMALFAVAKATADQQVTLIRAARRQEREAKANLDLLATAKAYALETGNYFPLMALTDSSVRHELRHVDGGDKLMTVPEGWKPKSAAAATEAPAVQ